MKKYNSETKCETKKVIFVCSTLNTGGAQKMLSNLLTGLPDYWDADIVLNSDNNICYPYKGNIISLNIKDSINKQSVLYQAKVFCARVRVLTKLKRTKKYVACISILDSSNVANILSGNRFCKTIITSVIQMSKAKESLVYRFLVFPMIRLFYNHSDKMIVQTKDAFDDLHRNFGIKTSILRVIPTGIDTEAIRDTLCLKMNDSLRRLFNKTRTIVSAGRLAQQKGQWHLIRAFKEVVAQVPDANLVIFGEGELKNDLGRQIKLLGLSNVVSICPFDAHLDLYIANSAIFAFPSQYEGMPVALLEALACDVACIATDFHAGAREVLGLDDFARVDSLTEADYGIITPICEDEIDIDEVELTEAEQFLAEGIIHLLKDADYRQHFADLALKRSNDYDMKNIMKAWIKEIEE